VEVQESGDVRNGQHIFCGLLVHGGQLPSFAGGLHFGPTANAAGSFSQARHLAFFDKYLRGDDVEIPAVRYFVMGSNRWRNAAEWPLPELKVPASELAAWCRRFGLPCNGESEGRPVVAFAPGAVGPSKRWP